MRPQSWVEIAITVVALVVMTIAATVQATNARRSARLIRNALDISADADETTDPIFREYWAAAAALVSLQIIAVIIAAAALSDLFDEETRLPAVVLALVSVAASYAIFGMALPRALAGARLAAIDHASERAAPVLQRLAWPVTTPVRGLTRLFLRVLPRGPVNEATRGNGEEVAANPAETGLHLDQEDEYRMISGVRHLEETPVRDIMVPRVDIVAVERDTRPAEVIEVIVGAGHSRIPVYDETIDHILGILYAKDLLPFVMGSTADLSLEKLVRPAYFVPESKRVGDLLKELRRDKVHMTVVVDEYGGTAGLATIEDILEEIVGEIQDEYDIEEPLFTLINGSSLEADGRLPLDDLADLLDVTIAEEPDVGTVGGLVLKQLGRLPRPGDEVKVDGLKIEVLAVEHHRAKRLRVSRLLADDTSDDGTVAEDEVEPHVMREP